jgi:hypothetical protein
MSSGAFRDAAISGPTAQSTVEGGWDSAGTLGRRYERHQEVAWCAAEAPATASPCFPRPVPYIGRSFRRHCGGPGFVVGTPRRGRRNEWTKVVHATPGRDHRFLLRRRRHGLCISRTRVSFLCVKAICHVGIQYIYIGIVRPRGGDLRYHWSRPKSHGDRINPPRAHEEEPVSGTGTPVVCEKIPDRVPPTSSGCVGRATNQEPAICSSILLLSPDARHSSSNGGAGADRAYWRCRASSVR